MSLRPLSLLFALLLTLAAPFSSGAAAAARASGTLHAIEVRNAVLAYAQRRGIRPGSVGVEVLGLTDSKKSTRAKITIDGQVTTVAINHATGRVQPRLTATLVASLVTAHRPYKRAGLGYESSFATMLVDAQLGEGARPAGLGDKAAPLGTPRVNTSKAGQALDALSLGRRGTVSVALGRDLIVGRPGAAVRVRENGIANAQGDIINQTPGLVEVMAGNKWYRLGYAGYRAGGDTLYLANAMDKLPAGSAVSLVRVTDAPDAPHPHGIDATDNALASARGVGGFDLVSVEGVTGSPVMRR